MVRQWHKMRRFITRMRGMEARRCPLRLAGDAALPPLLFERVLRQSAEPILVSDKSERLILVNDASRRLLDGDLEGKSLDNITGKLPTTVVACPRLPHRRRPRPRHEGRLRARPQPAGTPRDRQGRPRCAASPSAVPTPSQKPEVPLNQDLALGRDIAKLAH